MAAAAAAVGFGASLSTRAIGARREDVRALSERAFATPAHQAAVCPPVVQPVAKRICDLTGKKWNNGYKVSFSNHREKHIQYANLQYKRVWWEQGKRFVRLHLSTKALKTLEWKGLDKMAKEAGINLKDY